MTGVLSWRIDDPLGKTSQQDEEEEELPYVSFKERLRAGAGKTESWGSFASRREGRAVGLVSSYHCGQISEDKV